MKIVLINLDSDTDRLKRSSKELARYGLSFERIPGVLNPDDPAAGFSQAMVNALKAIPKGGAIFEDDIRLVNYKPVRVPNGWDMLYLGANLQGPTIRINKDLVKLTAAWTTHGIIYSRQGVEKVLSLYSYSKHGIYDDWLKREFIAANQCYLVTPMQAYQYPGQSRLFGGSANYDAVMNNNFKEFVN